MNKNEMYVIRVEHDPGDIFQKGAIIPYSEFLIGIGMGVYSEGMRITKVAPIFDFVVGVSEKGSNVLIDSHNTPWYVITNSNNRGYIQAKRKYVSRGQLAKADHLQW